MYIYIYTHSAILTQWKPQFILGQHLIQLNIPQPGLYTDIQIGRIECQHTFHVIEIDTYRDLCGCECSAVRSTPTKGNNRYLVCMADLHDFTHFLSARDVRDILGMYKACTYIYTYNIYVYIQYIYVPSKQQLSSNFNLRFRI